MCEHTTWIGDSRWLPHHGRTTQLQQPHPGGSDSRDHGRSRPEPLLTARQPSKRRVRSAGAVALAHLTKALRVDVFRTSGCARIDSPPQHRAPLRTLQAQLSTPLQPRQRPLKEDLHADHPACSTGEPLPVELGGAASSRHLRITRGSDDRQTPVEPFTASSWRPPPSQKGWSHGDRQMPRPWTTKR
jgi:hypothetical protein